MKVLQGSPYNEQYKIERTSASNSLETAIKKKAKVISNLVKSYSKKYHLKEGDIFLDYFNIIFQMNY